MIPSHPQKRINKLMHCILLAVCGAVFALPLVFGAAWLVTWIALVPVIITESKKTLSHHYLISSYFRGMCFFMAFGLVTFSWFWQLYPLDYMGFTAGEALVVVLAAHIGLSLIQAVVSSFIFVMWGLCRKNNFTFSHPFIFSIYTGCAWVINEWLQSVSWAGVPWGRLALTQFSFLPAVQSASFLGSYLVTFIIVFVNCAIATALICKRCIRRYLAVSAAAVFALNILFGAIRIAVTESALKDGDKVRVAAVQGNITTDEKWNSRLDSVLKRYRDLSVEAAEDGAKLILWPETAVNYDISTSNKIAVSLEETSGICNAELLCGVFQTEDNNLYNVIRYVTPSDGIDNKTIYKKQHLVPFGEYVPGEEIIRKICPPLAELSPIDYPVSAGNSSAVIKTSVGKVSCLICFDSIYGELALKGVRDGGELICISTNDSWFDGSAAQHQHNTHAALRAIECGRYVLRAANTGISSIITPTGRVTDSLEYGNTGYITGEVCFIDSMTPYAVLGSIAVPISASAAAFITIYMFRKKNNNDGNTHR